MKIISSYRSNRCSTPKRGLAHADNHPEPNVYHFSFDKCVELENFINFARSHEEFLDERASFLDRIHNINRNELSKTLT